MARSISSLCQFLDIFQSFPVVLESFLDVLRSFSANFGSDQGLLLHNCCETLTPACAAAAAGRRPLPVYLAGTCPRSASRRAGRPKGGKWTIWPLSLSSAEGVD